MCSGAFRRSLILISTFDALGFPIHLDNFLKLFNRYSAARIVIDHCMKPVIREDAFNDWARGMKTIARETNVFCKLSGLPSEAKTGMDHGNAQALCRTHHRCASARPA